MARFRLFMILATIYFITRITFTESASRLGKVQSVPEFDSTSKVSREDISKFLDSNVSPTNIRANLRYLTSKVHMGGTAAELETALWVAKQWRVQGLDEVELVPYDVLLSYPHKEKPNVVRLTESRTGATVHESSARQLPLYAAEEHGQDVPFSFNAYSATSSVQGSVIYANYGRKEDFEYLDTRGISVSGRIVLARLGVIYRANIAHEAEKRNASGLILYNDPADFAADGPDSVYHDTIDLPSTGTQQGTIKLEHGDPLTPHYPAVESAYRIPEDEASCPKIPAMPVSYDDARYLLKTLSGSKVPSDWQGGLNFTYYFGPTSPSYQVTIDVHTEKQMATVRNVIGIIRGGEEPDRYVVLGSHRDAWLFGAVDPSSSQASLIELSRVLMLLHKETGWRPRRTLVFCSWAASEYGLMGSLEWIEQFKTQLQDRTVAYLNSDLIMLGTHSLAVTAAPLLYDVVFEASKLVSNPDPEEVAAGRPTLYDTWIYRTPHPVHSTRPETFPIGAASDYAGFIHHLGIPSLDICYNHDMTPTVWFPLYHSLYETFEAVDELYDPGFVYHSAVLRLWGQVAISLAQAQILPYSLCHYADYIQEAQRDMQQEYGELLADNNRTFKYFLEAGEVFSTVAKTFERNLKSVDLSNPLAVRKVNDQLMLVERSLIATSGLPDRPDFNHVVLSPSSSNAYVGSSFTPIADLLLLLSKTRWTYSEESAGLWKTLDQHLAAVTHHINSAAAVLTDQLWWTGRHLHNRYSDQFEMADSEFVSISSTEYDHTPEEL